MSFLHTAAPPERSFHDDIVRIASMRSVHSAFQWLHLRAQEFDDWHEELAGIPAPPFGEEQRGSWLKKRFEKIGLQDVSIDAAGNVLGYYREGKSRAPKRRVLVAAHLDTVFPEGTRYRVHRAGTRISAPGASDNTSGVIAMLACAAAIKHVGMHCEQEIVFAGTVGEEGEGNLRGMRHLFADTPWREQTTCTLVLDGAGTETIVNEALGSRRLEVVIRGPGGHSWNNHGTPNPVVLMAKIAAAAAEIELPEDPKTTFNVGSLHGGSSTNAIPEEATMRIDIRSTETVEIERVEKRFREIVGNELRVFTRPERKQGISFEIRTIGDRPAGALSEGARILSVVQAVDSHLDLDSCLRRASTDANIPLSLGLEAVSIGVGGSGDGAHTLHEWYDSAGREIGLKRVLLAMLSLAQAL